MDQQQLYNVLIEVLHNMQRVANSLEKMESSLERLVLVTAEGVTQYRANSEVNAPLTKKREE